MQGEEWEEGRGLLFIKMAFSKVHLAETIIEEIVLEGGRAAKR